MFWAAKPVNDFRSKNHSKSSFTLNPDLQNSPGCLAKVCAVSSESATNYVFLGSKKADTTKPARQPIADVVSESLQVYMRFQLAHWVTRHERKHFIPVWLDRSSRNSIIYVFVELFAPVGLIKANWTLRNCIHSSCLISWYMSLVFRCIYNFLQCRPFIYCSICWSFSPSRSIVFSCNSEAELCDDSCVGNILNSTQLTFVAFACIKEVWPCHSHGFGI